MPVSVPVVGVATSGGDAHRSPNSLDGCSNRLQVPLLPVATRKLGAQWNVRGTQRVKVLVSAWLLSDD